MRALLRPALLAGVALALLLGPSASAGPPARTGVYVALGDSYTSGPLIPDQHGNPIDCARSDHNYPSLVASALHVRTFVDVSCSGAQTKDMTAPQTGLPAGGTNPPQFAALRRDATLVTVGIGGNDAGLVSAGEKCGELGATHPTGHACRDHFAPGGRDTLQAKIDATKPKIAAVLQGIHRRSPDARVAIVGYPDVLPQHGSCYPAVPLSPDDIRYFDGVIRRINAMIASQAATNGAEYVDTYAGSVGHDVCTLPPTRWFEGLTPTQPAYPLHPNGQGEASMARSALAVLARPRPAPVLSRLRYAHGRVTYRLDRRARVTLTVRRRGHSRPVLVRQVTGRAGANRARMRVRRHGRYRLTAVPRADGRRGATRAVNFRR